MAAVHTLLRLTNPTHSSAIPFPFGSPTSPRCSMAACGWPTALVGLMGATSFGREASQPRRTASEFGCNCGSAAVLGAN